MLLNILVQIFSLFGFGEHFNAVKILYSEKQLSMDKPKYIYKIFTIFSHNQGY